MSALISKEKRGIVYTFYSFKGGSGRTMALANVAVLLAKWGHSVLVVDWDLEAPGLERFFSSDNAQAQTLRASKPGIIDLVQGRTNGKGLNWRDCLLEINPGQISSHLSMISAGRGGEDYIARLQSVDFAELFEKHDLGSYVEDLRNQRTSEFDLFSSIAARA